MRAPNLVIFEPTYRCNLRCVHCCVAAEGNHERELTAGEAIGVIDQIAEWQVPFLTIGGGEPLLRKDLFEITRHAAEHMSVTLTTNGFFFDKSIAKLAISSGVSSVIVSLDSTDAQRHDSIRGKKGSYDRALEAVINCMSAGLPCCISATLMKCNTSDIAALAKLSKSLGLSTFQVNRFVPIGRGKQNRNELELTAKEYLESLAEINRLRREMKSLFIQICHDPQETIVGGTEPGQKGGGCIAGKGWAVITPTGDLLPCPFYPAKIGNVLEKPLSELWRTSPFARETGNRCLVFSTTYR